MKWSCTPLLFLLICFTSLSYASMSSTNYTISSAVISGGGGNMSSASYSITSTVGQPSPSGTSASADFHVNTGFWYTLLLTMIGDVNGDGIVDLKDVITALQLVTGQSPAMIMKQADTDGDGKIGLSESLYILKVLGM